MVCIRVERIIEGDDGMWITLAPQHYRPNFRFVEPEMQDGVIELGEQAASGQKSGPSEVIVIGSAGAGRAG